MSKTLMVALCAAFLTTAADASQASKDPSKEPLITSKDLNVYLVARDTNKQSKSMVLGLLFDYAKPQGGHGVQSARSNKVTLHVRCAQNEWNISKFQPFAGTGGTGRALAPAHPNVPDNAWVKMQADLDKVKDPGESLMNQISLGACNWLADQLALPAA